MKRSNIFAIFLLVLSVNSTFAAFGDPDTTFGSNGQVVFFQASGIYWGQAHALERQSDGKLIVSGTAWGQNQTKYVTIRRYLANGAIDTSYGIQGTAVPYESIGDIQYSVLQSDGKLLVTGTINVGGTDSMYIWRFNTNGLYDSTFGANGRVYIGAGYAGKIAVYKTSPSSNTEYILIGYNGVRRRNPNGSASVSFGSGSVIYGAGSRFSVKTATAVSNARIVVADVGSNTNVILSAFDGNGQPDTSFGTNGSTSTFYGNYDAFYLRDPVLSPQGKHLVYGAYSAGGGIAFGSIIGSHSSSGVLEYTNTPSLLNNYFATLATNSDGTIVFSAKNINPQQVPTLRKFTSNVSQLFQAPNVDCYDILIQPDTKIVCATGHTVFRYNQ